jgi:hypothetical protein
MPNKEVQDGDLPPFMRFVMRATTNVLLLMMVFFGGKELLTMHSHFLDTTANTVKSTNESIATMAKALEVHADVSRDQVNLLGEQTKILSDINAKLDKKVITSKDG